MLVALAVDGKKKAIDLSKLRLVNRLENRFDKGIGIGIAIGIGAQIAAAVRRIFPPFCSQRPLPLHTSTRFDQLWLPPRRASAL